MYSSFKKHQLITESWRKFLTEAISDVEQHNIDFFTKEIATIPYLNSELTSIFNNVNPSQIILKIQPLAKSKITKFIDAGAFGIVLGLDNGHVLKLYVSRTRDSEQAGGKPEEEFYKKSMDDLHSGKATRSTLPVYAMGAVNLMGRDTKKRVLRFVEMALLEPSNQFEETIQSAIYYSLSDIRERILDQEDNLMFVKNPNLNSDDFNRDRESMKNYLIKKGVSEQIAERIVNNLFSSIEEMIKKHGIDSIKDLHSGNIAIDRTSPRDDPKFVLFDP
jgi:hypothetical protein